MSEMDKQAVTIKMDDAALQTSLEEFSKLLLEIRNRFVNISGNASQFFSVKADTSAADTGDIVVIVKPTDGFLMLLSAIRALNVNLCAIDGECHHTVLSKKGIITDSQTRESGA